MKSPSTPPRTLRAQFASPDCFHYRSNTDGTAERGKQEAWNAIFQSQWTTLVCPSPCADQSIEHTDYVGRWHYTEYGFRCHSLSHIVELLCPSFGHKASIHLSWIMSFCPSSRHQSVILGALPIENKSHHLKTMLIFPLCMFC